MRNDRAGPRSWLTASATVFNASISSPESVSSRIASRGSSTASCRISLRFFSPPEKPSFTGRFIIESSQPIALSFCSRTCKKSIGSSSGSPRSRRSALSADRRKYEFVMPRISTGYWKARKTGARTLLRLHVEQVFTLVLRASREHRIRRMTGEDLGQRALARAVRSHDRVHFTFANREIDTLEDLVARDCDTETFDFQQRVSRFPCP